ncbi:MAG: hypothetical protein U0Q16_37945 [Bryobacteraceae bacterium]
MSHRGIVWAALLSVAAAQAQQKPLRISLAGEPPVVHVEGSGILGRINNPNYSGIFQLSVDQAGAPPLAGAFAMEGSTLVFTPKYPLQPGLSYRATFKLVNEVGAATLVVPKPKVVSTTVVERIFPSTAELPENQLKFYLHFSAPMSKGEAFKRLHLLEDGAGEVKLPFLEIDEELWDKEFRRLTVLFDPGRVKRGLVPNQEVGPPLKAGKKYTLVIDADWKDAKGVPLKQGARKMFAAVPAERSPIDPKVWKLSSPKAGSMEPLVADFPRPYDAALLQRFIDVTSANGALVKGKVMLEQDETRWIFTPAAPWVAGKHALEIISTLEDLAGNKIGRAFDVDKFDQVQQRSVSDVYSLPFEVK